MTEIYYVPIALDTVETVAVGVWKQNLNQDNAGDDNTPFAHAVMIIITQVRRIMEEYLR